MSEERHCRLLSTHDEHEYQKRGWMESLLGWVWVPKGEIFTCPGNPHVDHSERCCREHGTHSMPHIGCVLR